MYREFSHDVKAAILVFQNSETAAMLLYQDNPVSFKIVNCNLVTHGALRSS